MEHLAKKLTNYILEKEIITEELVGESQSLCKPLKWCKM